MCGFIFFCGFFLHGPGSELVRLIKSRGSWSLTGRVSAYGVQVLVDVLVGYVIGGITWVLARYKTPEAERESINDSVDGVIDMLKEMHIDRLRKRFVMIHLACHLLILQSSLIWLIYISM
jgi:hypothetical protein